MDISKKYFLNKFAASESKPKKDLIGDFIINGDSDENSPLLLNGKLPSKKELEGMDTKGPSGYSDTMNAKIVDGESNYTWQDAKQITVNRAKTQDYNLKLRSDALGENKNKVVNSNKPVLDKDWPGMFGLKCPTVADGRYVATGNGKGGEIFPRSQIKMAGIQTDDRGDTVLWDKPFSQSLWETAAEAAGAFSSLTPFRYTWEKAKESPFSGMTHGVWSNALLGGLLGAAYNRWMRPKKIVVKRDPETGEIYEDEEVDTEQNPMWKDVLTGAGIGGLSGGVLGYNFGKDHQHAKYSFAMGPDVLSTINSKIMADSSLDFEQRRALMNYIKTLPNHTLASLLPTIGSLFGAGAGAAIARKLLGMGLGGSVLGALLGGMMGHGIGYNASQNAKTPFNPLAGSGFSDTFGFKF